MTKGVRPPKLVELYRARSAGYPLPTMTFEPFGDLFLAGLLSDEMGDSSSNWVRLARGEKVTMPPAANSNQDNGQNADMLETAPGPKHTISFTLGSTLTAQQDHPRRD